MFEKLFITGFGKFLVLYVPLIVSYNLLCGQNISNNVIEYSLLIAVAVLFQVTMMLNRGMIFEILDDICTISHSNIIVSYLAVLIRYRTCEHFMERIYTLFGVLMIFRLTMLLVRHFVSTNIINPDVVFQSSASNIYIQRVLAIESYGFILLYIIYALL